MSVLYSLEDEDLFGKIRGYALNQNNTAIVHAANAGIRNSISNSRPIPDALDRVCLAAKTAADHKGKEIVVLDLRQITPMFDYFLLVTGDSRRQVHTIVEEIDDALRKVGDRRMSVEGYDTSKWVVQDYGDVVVHVFDTDTRDYYKLEDLWADALRIDWEQEYDPELSNS